MKTRYRTKQIEVKAHQWNGNNARMMLQIIPKDMDLQATQPTNQLVLIQEGVIYSMEIGQWLVVYPDESFIIVNDELFERQFE